jgi:deoxycytidylate deaminase/phosphopantetheine adenylyltransferase
LAGVYDGIIQQMAEWRSKNEVVIPGGFDVIHGDHVKWIEKCIDTAKNRIGQIDMVTIALASDELLSLKGGSRPFFTYDWRFVDMCRLLEGMSGFSRYRVVEMDEADFTKNAGSKGELVLVTEEYEDYYIGKNDKISFLSPLNSSHTSDLERQLFSAVEGSHCKIRQVGAAIVRRYKGIIAVNKNGPSAEGGCELCPKYIDIMAKYAQCGEILASPVECSHLHAEEAVIKMVKCGSSDWLFTTTSPCWNCAKIIASTGITRVVYIYPYYNLDPVRWLAEKGCVDIRQAGTDPNGLSFQVRSPLPGYYLNRF